MFSARKKQKKEIPQWKLDQMRAEEEERSGSLAAREPEAPPPEPEKPRSSTGAASSSCTTATAAPARARSPDPNAELWGEPAADDDDDDDDFDASKYELGGGEEEGEVEEEPGGRAEACCVSVTGIAHQTMGDHLQSFFADCGGVVKVLRSVDVRDRTAFITFDSPSAASAAVAKTGARLHDRELTVALANEAGGGGAAPLSSLGSSRDEQLAVLGIDAGRSTGRGSVGKAMRGVVYSNDHSPGFLKHKQGVDAGGFVPGISRGAHQSTGALRPPLYAPLPLPGHRAPRPRTRAPTTVSLSRSRSRSHTHRRGLDHPVQRHAAPAWHRADRRRLGMQGVRQLELGAPLELQQVRAAEARVK